METLFSIFYFQDTQPTYLAFKSKKEALEAREYLREKLDAFINGHSYEINDKDVNYKIEMHYNDEKN